MTYNKLKVIWKSSDGSLIACKEKIKVLAVSYTHLTLPPSDLV